MNRTGLIYEACARLEDEKLADRGQRMIELAEVELNRRLRVADMESEATLTFTDGVAALPADFLGVRALTAAEGYRMRPKPLAQIRSDHVTGYAQVGDNIETNYRTSTAALDYYAKLPAITTANTTNWLLTGNPEVYIYATMKQGALMRSDPEKAALANGYLTSLIEDMQVDDASRRLSSLSFGGVAP